MAEKLLLKLSLMAEKLLLKLSLMAENLLLIASPSHARDGAEMSTSPRCARPRGQRCHSNARFAPRPLAWRRSGLAAPVGAWYVNGMVNRGRALRRRALFTRALNPQSAVVF